MILFVLYSMFILGTYIVSTKRFNVLNNIINHPESDRSNKVYDLFLGNFVNDSYIKFDEYLQKVRKIEYLFLRGTKKKKIYSPIAAQLGSSVKKLILVNTAWFLFIIVLYMLSTNTWGILKPVTIYNYKIFQEISSYVFKIFSSKDFSQISKYVTPIVTLITILFVTQRSRGYAEGQREMHKCAINYIRKNYLPIEYILSSVKGMLEASINYYNYIINIVNEGNLEMLHKDSNKYSDIYYEFYKYQNIVYENMSVFVLNMYDNIVLKGLLEEFYIALKKECYGSTLIADNYMKYLYNYLDKGFFSAQLADSNTFDIGISPEYLWCSAQINFLKNVDYVSEKSFYNYKLKYLQELRKSFEYLVRMSIYWRSISPRNNESIPTKFFAYINI